MADEPQALTFEQGLEKLEQIVAELEGGKLTLEQSLGLFAQGVDLSRSCRTQLQEAETKVEALLEKDGKRVPEPFGLDDADDPAF